VRVPTPSDPPAAAFLGSGYRGTLEERVEHGRQARARLPRSALGRYAPTGDRPDPVSVLLHQDAQRLPALTPMRHRRMAASPFAFYRGGAGIMAVDLGARVTSELRTQLCGDAHVANFGLFAAPDRTLVFDVNDFDETSPGPFEWDVLRLATSFTVAGPEIGLTPARMRDAAASVARGYREQIARQSRSSDIANWYERMNVGFLDSWSKGEGRAVAKTLKRSLVKADTRDIWSAVDKMTTVKDGRRELINQPPLVLRFPLDGTAAERLEAIMRDYVASMPADRTELLGRYRIVDMGHKVVGVGSVGLLALVVLLQGRDENDVIALQAKQAVSSVLEPFTGESSFAEHGQRVVVGQQLMQAATDPLLGWVTPRSGRSFYLRQLRDKKYAPDISRMKPKAVVDYALLCGRALARAHARAGDPVAISAYVGKGHSFTKAVVDFAFGYGRQVHLDYRAYTEAIAQGRVEVGEKDDGRHMVITTDSSERITIENEY